MHFIILVLHKTIFRFIRVAVKPQNSQKTALDSGRWSLDGLYFTDYKLPVTRHFGSAGHHLPGLWPNPRWQKFGFVFAGDDAVAGECEAFGCGEGGFGVFKASGALSEAGGGIGGGGSLSLGYPENSGRGSG